MMKNSVEYGVGIIYVNRIGKILSINFAGYNVLSKRGVSREITNISEIIPDFENKLENADSCEWEIYYEVSIKCSILIKKSGSDADRYSLIILPARFNSNVGYLSITEKAEFTAILDNLPYSVWIKDVNGKYLHVNKKFLEVCSVDSLENVIGKTDFEIWPYDLASCYRDIDNEVMLSRKQQLIEEKAVEGGRTLWVETFKSPVVNNNGELIGTTGFYRDISARKFAEERRISESDGKFRALFNSLGDGAIVCELTDYSLLEANDAICKMLGYERGELLGLKANQLIISNVNTKFFCDVEVGNSVSYTCNIITRLMNSLPVEVTESCFQLNERKVMVLLVRDISDRYKLERQRREFSIRIREEEKTRVAREIHDNLGGILTAIKIDIDWISSNWMNRNRRNNVSDRMASISQLVSDSIVAIREIIGELRPSIINDLGLIAAIKWHSRQFSERTGIVCEVVTSDSSGSLDSMSNELVINLYRIFQEALSNVSKHSHANSVYVYVEANKCLFSLTVQDDGIGFDDLSHKCETSYGIRGIAERIELLGGRMKISGQNGFCLEVSIPI